MHPIFSKKGKVLGTGVCPGVDEIQELIVDEVGGFIDPLLNERLLGILSTKENVNLETLGFVDHVKEYTAIITPIDIAGERLGTLFVYREDRQYDIDDIILSEYGTTVVGGECGGDKKGSDCQICNQHVVIFGIGSDHSYF